jgi:hypothetical protein
MKENEWETPKIQIIDVKCETLGGFNSGEDYLEQS